ncbi:MAG: SDR family oxidoreductase [Gammaproteobacteria bacterium]|nr:SDR family oxidoreductase [Gammaproteobacteria bacterium]
MNEPLAGKFAVVTGAASGIGAAAVQALAARGARVAGIDRKPSTVPEGDLALTADVSSEEEVLAAFAALDAAGEVPDILVNCAGIILERPLVRMTLEEFERIMRVNLRGCFLVGREAVIRMRDAGRGGRVINIASELAHLGRADYSAYCASKAAVIGLTRSWARELAPDILVNAVAPGPVDTPMLSRESMSPDVLAQESDLPLGRIGRPEEIASVIAFLAGPGATYVTGQTFGPNGGAVMT